MGYYNIHISNRFTFGTQYQHPGGRNDYRDDLRQAERREMSRQNMIMLSQKTSHLENRLQTGRISGQYTHILGSKDLLKDIRDKYDDLAKVSYFDNDNQVNW